VHVGPVVRETEGGHGRELEFILRSLVELKIQMEELRRRMDDEESGDLREITGPGRFREIAGAIEPQDQAPPPNAVTVRPGMTMAGIERAAIEAALKETRGNRRRAAELLDIGERTMYRKLRDYGLVAGGVE
jgi:DNA-binding NtrC family response regulator